MGEADRPPEEKGARLLEALLGSALPGRVAPVIITVAPAAYLCATIYFRTGDVILMIGAGIICPAAIYMIIQTWLDESSALTRTSWAEWSANRADKTPLVFAAVGALIFIGFITLMWIAGSAIISQY